MYRLLIIVVAVLVLATAAWCSLMFKREVNGEPRNGAMSIEDWAKLGGSLSLAVFMFALIAAGPA